MFADLIKDSKAYAVTLGFMAKMHQYFSGLSKSNQALMTTIISLLQSVSRYYCYSLRII
jgi:hypothetical protein